ncbi:MAG: sensor histidine kinase [Candidatus Thorarchaeota archaeon]
MTEPSPEIDSGGPTLKARYVSTALFAGCIVFPVLQITSVVIQEMPIYTAMTFIAAGLYLVSRTQYYEIAAKIGIILVSILPFIALAANPVWDQRGLMFQIITWPVLAVVIGSQILSPKSETVLAFLLNAGLVVSVVVHPGIAIGMAAEVIGAEIALTILVLLGNWTHMYYVDQLEKRNRDLDERQKELQIYTSLLTHDLGNDMQVVIGGIELSSLMLPSQEGRISEQLQTSLAAGERMASLLKLFSAPPADGLEDVVSMLEYIVDLAKMTDKNLSIEISADKESREVRPTSRLVSTVFQNLIRNASQHAGDNPSVEVMVKMQQEILEVIICDDGPGVPAQFIDVIFQKGFTTKGGAGMGLYLTKSIMEHLGGKIELIDIVDRDGCAFRLLIPIQQVAKDELGYSRVLRQGPRT